MAVDNKKEAITFIWRGKDKDGKIRKNEVIAANEQLVRSYLNKQGITPLSVVAKAKPLMESKGSIKTKNIVSFSRQMTTMLRAGMSVTKALNLIEVGVKKPLAYRDLLKDVREEVEGGCAFYEALAKHPVQFNDLYVSLISAGEEAGVLEDTMEKLATNMEKTETIKKKVKKALTYPAIVVLAAIVVTAILLIKVIPVFEGFFAGFGADLPMLTQKVVAFSNWARTDGWMLPVGFGIFVYVFFYIKKRNRTFQKNMNKFSFKVPILGGVLQLGAMARFARTLSVLFESGVPLVKALYATGPATGSVVYEEATLEVAKDVENGSQLNFSMQNTEKFDPFAIQMVGIGEESGNLGEMLANVADFYEEELDYKIDNLMTMIEPLIICFLAVVVGTLVIAMYLPIFMLGDVV